MNRPAFHSLPAVLLAAVPALALAGAEMRDLPSAAELEERRQQTPEHRVIPGVREGRPERVPDGQSSVLGNSLILGDGRQWTVLPRGAVVHFPEDLKGQLQQGRNGRLVPWNEFQAANRWQIESHALLPAHLNGTAEIPAHVLEAWAVSRRLVVTTFNGHPVAMPQKKETDSSSTNGESAASRR